MHIHILGICGTFMAGIAQIAREQGYQVSGSDQNTYPPMSTQLEALDITLYQGYDPGQLDPAPDCVVIGNALSRGNPAVEYVLDHNLPYTSGPAFLAQHLLRQRWVLAVAGTHGKTTTSSMLAWILQYAGLEPGFLIGGIPLDFESSARLGQAPFFVVEADEYDTAFFDKRSKFVHYHPRTLVLNNLEFDHADIFADLEAIQHQFHHLIRTVPGKGLIVSSMADKNLEAVIQRGCWTPLEYFSIGGSDDGKRQWWVANQSQDGSEFEIYFEKQLLGRVSWSHMGRHNMHNALAAIAAARHAGVLPQQAVAALSHYQGVKRRMEKRGDINGISIYDDFAHHPTAIATTLEGLRQRVGGERIIAILEPRSNTMRMGIHRAALVGVFAQADEVIFYQPPDLSWGLTEVAEQLGGKARVFDRVDTIVDYISTHSRSGDHILIMSNGAFGGIHDKLILGLTRRQQPAASPPAQQKDLGVAK